MVITSSISPGQNSFTVTGSTHRVGQWIALSPYSNGCEFLKIASVSGQTVTTTTNALKSHSSNTLAVLNNFPAWDIVLFGAKTNGTADNNRVSIQAAVDNCHALGGGNIYIPKGEFIVNRNPGVGSTEIGSILLNSKSNLWFIGSGMGNSKITLEAGSYATDTMIFYCNGCTNFGFRDFTIYGNRGNHSVTNEQMHGVEVLDCSNFHFERLYFDQMRSDGIRLLANTETKGVRVVNCIFDTNGRSGITCQRLTKEVWITDNTFIASNDQSVDFEPTGSGEPESYIISGNLIDHTGAGGEIGVTLTGNVLTSKIKFISNTLLGCTLLCQDLKDSEISGNYVSGGSGNNQATFEYIKSGEGLKVIGNTFIANASGARVINCFRQDDQEITDAIFSNNYCYGSASNISIVRFENCYGIDFINNEIYGRTTNSVIYGLDIEFTRTDTLIQKSHFSVNSLKTYNCNISVQLRWANSNYKLDTIQIVNVSAFDQKAVAELSNVVVVSNAGTGTDRYINTLLISNISTNILTATPVSIGSNVKFYKTLSGIISQYVSTLTPEGLITERVGGQCFDQTSNKLYIKGAGTDNTGWVILWE